MGWGIRLQDAFGTCGQAFATSEINHLMAAARLPDGTLDNTRLNAFLAVINGTQPANEVEAMLACQMAISHSLIMELVRRASRADQIPQFEAAGNMAAKLLKAFAGHAELLNKLKRGGEQTVRVEHVHVHAGGQAIVGNVAPGAKGSTGTGGRGVEKNGNQPHAPQNCHPRTAIPPALASPALQGKTRSGSPCQSPAVKGRLRCRMHGGALGSGAPAGKRNGRYRHGQQTKSARAERPQGRRVGADDAGNGAGGGGVSRDRA